MKSLVLLLALLFSVVASEEMCCVECTREGEIKYYSIDFCWIDVENAV